MNYYSPLPRDVEKTVIQGAINGIPYIQNFTVTSGTWTAIILYSEECKQLILQPRDMITWKLSTTSGGNYFTMRNGAALHAPVVTSSGNTICWVGSDYNTIFELMVGK